MSTVGLAAIVALVTAGLAMIALRARRRRAAAVRPPGPRTVAELVQLRAAAAAAAQSDLAAQSGPAVPSGPAVQSDLAAQSGPAAQSDPAAQSGLAAQSATAGQTGPPAPTGSADQSEPAAHVEPAAKPEAATGPDAATDPEPATGRVRGATSTPTDESPLGDRAGQAAQSAVNGSADLPWNRARRLIAAADKPPAARTGRVPAPVSADQPTDAPVVVPPATSAAESSVPAPPRPTDITEPPPSAPTASDPGGHPAAEPNAAREPAGPPPTATRQTADLAEVRAPAVETSDESRSLPARPLRLVPPLPAAEIPAQRIPVADVDLAVLGRLGLLDPTAEPEPVLNTSGVDSRMSGVDEQAGPTQRVRFRVTRRDGSVVPGACVALLDGSGREVASGYADAYGSGELCAPRPGSYLLLAAAPGHQPGAATASIVDCAAEVPVLLSRSAALAGSVHGPQGPVVAARVTLVQSGEVVDATRSDSIGGYRLTDLAAGGYGLSISAPGCVPIALQIDVPDGADLRRDVELSRDGQAASAVRPEPVAEPARQAAGHR